MKITQKKKSFPVNLDVQITPQDIDYERIRSDRQAEMTGEKMAACSDAYLETLSGFGGYVPRYYTVIASAERLMEVEQYEDADGSVICSADTDIAEHKRDVLQDVSFSIAKAIMWRLPELPAVASLPC